MSITQTSFHAKKKEATWNLIVKRHPKRGVAHGVALNYSKYGNHGQFMM